MTGLRWRAEWLCRPDSRRRLFICGAIWKGKVFPQVRRSGRSSSLGAQSEALG
jgi:hypothetical protein